MKFIEILFLIILLFFISCSTKVEFEIPKTEQMLVLNSLIAPDSVFLVKLSKTAPIISNDREGVNNADIEVWVNGSFKEKLIQIDEGIYKTSFTPKVDTLYTLYVNVTGFDKLKATTKIPSQPIVNSGFVEFDKYYAHEISQYVASAEISLYNPLTEVNYYQILFYSFVYYPIYSEGNDTIPIDSVKQISNIFYLKSNEPAILNEGEIQSNRGGDVTDNLIFSDNLLDRNTDLVFWVSLIHAWKYHNSALIRSISPEYYLYQRSLIRQFVNINFNAFFDLNTLFLSDNPNDLYSNVENGLGIFAGYSETHYELTVIE